MRCPLQWDWHDWSLSVVRERWPDGRPHVSHTLFGLRCCLCRRFTVGCSKHWFCDLCEPCRVKAEAEDDEPQTYPAGTTIVTP